MVSKFFIEDSKERLNNKLVLTRGEIPPGPHDNHIAFRPASGYHQGVVEVKTGEPAADATVAHAGPYAGEGAAAPAAGKPAEKRWTTQYGSSISLEGDLGQEAIEIKHNTGAHVVIRPDGAIYLYSTGKKGFGMVASKGDGTISAKGRIIIDAEDLIIQSKGDIQFQATGSIRTFAGKDIHQKASGSAYHEIDGRLITDVGLDNNHTVGGHMRQTVAGNIRMQTPNELRTDSKSATMKTTESIELDATKSMYIRAKDDTNISTSDGGINVSSKDRAVFGSSAGETQILAATSMNVEGGQHMSLKAPKMVQHVDGNMYTDVTGTTKFATGGDFTINAVGNMKTTSGEKTTVSAGTSLSTRSGTQTDMSSAASMKFDASAPIDMRGTTIDFNVASPNPTDPDDVLHPEVTTYRSLPTPDAPEAAEFPDSRAIIGSMITSADIPDFPYNAKKMSANEFSTLQNEGGQPNPKAEQYAARNVGGGTRASSGGGSYGEIPTFPEYNTSVATEAPFPAPTGTEVPETVSRNVNSFPGYTSIPGEGQNGASQAEIIKNIQHLSHNIIDPLIEHYGSEVTLTSGFRIKSDNRNSKHYIGKAIDLRASNKSDYAKTAEIAKWIVDNLPFDRVFLEKNDEGGIHVHAEAAPAGGRGSKTVWTCADKYCNSRIDGLHLEYAVKALKKSTKN